MNKSTVCLIAMSFLAMASCGVEQQGGTISEDEEFIGLTPQEMQWSQLPEDEGILHVTVLGNPDESGLFVSRYAIPPNTEVEPHTHRDGRSYTILAGNWFTGFGETYDEQELRSFPQGSFFRLPAGVAHFHRAGPDGAVIQIESFGPDSFDVIDGE